MILKTDGSLWATGSNSNGQFGNGEIAGRMRGGGPPSRQAEPLKVMNSVERVAVGESHTMVAKNDGSLWGTGEIGLGSVGIGDGTTDTHQTFVHIMNDVTDVSASAYHSLIVKGDGTLWATGSNEVGQLGDGTTETRTSPVRVMSGVRSAAAGESHTMIVRTDGTLWATGANDSGQLADGTFEMLETPIEVAADVVTVSARGRRSMFIKSDGTVWLTGVGKDLARLIYRLRLVRIMSDVDSVSAGRNHSVILKTDGSVWATGDNQGGWFGNGTDWSSAESPIEIMNGVSALSAGDTHTLFLGQDGVVRAAGRNHVGQLGDGSREDRHVPTQVMTDVASVSAGSLLIPYNRRYFVRSRLTRTRGIGSRTGILRKISRNPARDDHEKCRIGVGRHGAYDDRNKRR